jgi:hypothetical protein
MVNPSLTSVEVEDFRSSEKQMGIPERTVEKLKQEGIKHPKDLFDFDKDTLHQVAENLRKLPIGLSTRMGKLFMMNLTCSAPSPTREYLKQLS